MSRPTRLHWLTGRRTARENWDAYEAPDGEPLGSRTASADGWPRVKLWLRDLVGELAASAADGSMPALDASRVWIRQNDRVVLLDVPIPGSPSRGVAGGENCTPADLIALVVKKGLGDLDHQNPPIPVSARAAIDRATRSTASELPAVREAIDAAVAVPNRVRQWQRAIPIGLAALPSLCLLAATVLVAIPLMSRLLNPDNLEIVHLLGNLEPRNYPPGSRNADPVVRAGMERYLVGRHGARLRDESFWNDGLMQQAFGLGRFRFVGEAALTKYPEVSPEQTAESAALIAPELERVRVSPRAADLRSMAGIIASTLAALALGLAMVCSLVSSAVVPGGILTRLLGLAVVTSDGREIGRLRSILRSAVAWLPVVAWFAWLMAAPRIQGWVPMPSAPVAAVALVLGALGVGAVWVLARPWRGPHDYLTGTWVVTR